MAENCSESHIPGATLCAGVRAPHRPRKRRADSVAVAQDLAQNSDLKAAYLHYLDGIPEPARAHDALSFGSFRQWVYKKPSQGGLGWTSLRSQLQEKGLMAKSTPAVPHPLASLNLQPLSKVELQSSLDALVKAKHLPETSGHRKYIGVFRSAGYHAPTRAVKEHLAVCDPQGTKRRKPGSKPEAPEPQHHHYREPMHEMGFDHDQKLQVLSGLYVFNLTEYASGLPLASIVHPQRGCTIEFMLRTFFDITASMGLAPLYHCDDAAHFNGILFFFQLCCLLRNRQDALWERLCNKALQPGDSAEAMMHDVTLYLNTSWETDSKFLGHTSFHVQRRHAHGLVEWKNGPTFKIGSGPTNGPLERPHGDQNLDALAGFIQAAKIFWKACSPALRGNPEVMFSVSSMITAVLSPTLDLWRRQHSFLPVGHRSTQSKCQIVDAVERKAPIKFPCHLTPDGVLAVYRHPAVEDRAPDAQPRAVSRRPEGGGPDSTSIFGCLFQGATLQLLDAACLQFFTQPLLEDGIQRQFLSGRCLGAAVRLAQCMADHYEVTSALVFQIQEPMCSCPTRFRQLPGPTAWLEVETGRLLDHLQRTAPDAFTTVQATWNAAWETRMRAAAAGRHAEFVPRPGLQARRGTRTIIVNTQH